MTYKDFFEKMKNELNKTGIIKRYCNCPSYYGMENICVDGYMKQDCKKCWQLALNKITEGEDEIMTYKEFFGIIKNELDKTGLISAYEDCPSYLGMEDIKKDCLFSGDTIKCKECWKNALNKIAESEGDNDNG